MVGWWRFPGISRQDRWTTTMWWIWNDKSINLSFTFNQSHRHHLVLLLFPRKSSSFNHPFTAVLCSCQINLLIIVFSLFLLLWSSSSRCPQTHLEAFLQTRRARRGRLHLLHRPSWDRVCQSWWYHPRQSTSSFRDRQWCCSQHQEDPFTSQVIIIIIIIIICQVAPSNPVSNPSWFSTFACCFFCYDRLLEKRDDADPCHDGLSPRCTPPTSKPVEHRSLAGSPTKSPSSGLHKPTWKPSSKPAEH